MWIRESKHLENSAYLRMVTHLRINIVSSDISKIEIRLVSHVKNCVMCSVEFSCQESDFITTKGNLFLLSFVSLYYWSG
jgi:hypothetical protein